MQILCATDFSEPAVRAADVGAALAKAWQIPLRIIHCVPNWPLVVEPGITEALWTGWKTHLEVEAERLRAAEVEVNCELRRGSPSHELLAAVEEHPVRMIVIGSTGNGHATKWLLGSVAQRVAEAAPVPTLVVRDPESLLSWLKGDCPLEALCGVDLNLSSDAGLTAVKELRNLGRVIVDAVHIIEEKDRTLPRTRFVSPSIGEASQPPEVGPGRDVWKRAASILGEPPARVTVQRTLRHADHELAEIADSRHAGLVVVGTHQRHGLKRLEGRSFSRGLLTHASTNVLCVPMGSRSPEIRFPSIKRILVAHDLASAGKDALRHALGLLPAGGAIRLLHVVPVPASMLESPVKAEAAGSGALSYLESIISGLSGHPGIHLSAEAVVHSNTAAAICDSAEEFGADVICMGTRGHSRAGVAVLGSVMQAVAAMGHRPVLAIPPPPV